MKTIKLILLLVLLSTNYQFLMAQAGSAKLEYDNGTLDKAKEKIDAAIQNPKDADNAKTWYYRGLIYAAIANDQTGLYTDIAEDPITVAYEAYNKAEELNIKKYKDKGKDPKPYKGLDEARSQLHPVVINYGVAQYQSENINGAVDAFLLAQKTNPKDTLPFMYGADLSYQEKRFDDFETSVKKVLDMDIKNKIRYFATYAFYLNQEKENPEAALEVAQRGLKLDSSVDPDNFKILQSLALNLYIKLDKMDEAIEEVRKGAESASTDEDKALAYFNLGVLYERQKDYEKALEAYNKSKSINPTFDAVYNAGAMFFNKGVEIKKEADKMTLDEYNQKGKAIEDKAKVEFEKALPYFEELYKMQPKNSRVLGPLGQLYVIMKMEDKAAKINKEMEALEE